jgi:hypothetical protein
MRSTSDIGNNQFFSDQPVFRSIGVLSPPPSALHKPNRDYFVKGKGLTSANTFATSLRSPTYPAKFHNTHHFGNYNYHNPASGGASSVTPSKCQPHPYFQGESPQNGSGVVRLNFSNGDVRKIRKHEGMVLSPTHMFVKCVSPKVSESDMFLSIVRKFETILNSSTTSSSRKIFKLNKHKVKDTIPSLTFTYTHHLPVAEVGVSSGSGAKPSDVKDLLAQPFDITTISAFSQPTTTTTTTNNDTSEGEGEGEGSALEVKIKANLYLSSGKCPGVIIEMIHATTPNPNHDDVHSVNRSILYSHLFDALSSYLASAGDSGGEGGEKRFAEEVENKIIRNKNVLPHYHDLLHDAGDLDLDGDGDGDGMDLEVEGEGDGDMNSNLNHSDISMSANMKMNVNDILNNFNIITLLINQRTNNNNNNNLNGNGEGTSVCNNKSKLNFEKKYLERSIFTTTSANNNNYNCNYNFGYNVGGNDVGVDGFVLSTLEFIDVNMRRLNLPPNSCNSPLAGAGESDGIGDVNVNDDLFNKRLGTVISGIIVLLCKILSHVTVEADISTTSNSNSNSKSGLLVGRRNKGNEIFNNIDTVKKTLYNLRKFIPNFKRYVKQEFAVLADNCLAEIEVLF